MEIDSLAEPMEIEDFKEIFDNRVSQNIKDRIEYKRQLLLELQLDETRTNHCMRLYKYDENNKPIYRIGNKIILNERIRVDNGIGSNNLNSLIYKASIRLKITERPFQFLVKITKLDDLIEKEIKILEILTNALQENKCPHFPIIYSILKCNNFLNFNELSRTRSNSNSFASRGYNDINTYPIYMRQNRENELISILTETTNGNLNMFINEFYNNSQLLENAIAQIYFALMFFYSETKMYHCNSIGENFYYHKIKPGGYFHYRIFGINYYIENLGYLWVITDFKFSISLNDTDIKSKLLTMRGDFEKIILDSFTNFTDSEQESNGSYFTFKKNFNDDFKEKIMNIYYNLFRDKKKYGQDNLNVFLTALLKELFKCKIILTNKKLYTKINYNTVKILNKEPYIIYYFTEFQKPLEKIYKDYETVVKFITKHKGTGIRRGGAVKKILKSYK